MVPVLGATLEPGMIMAIIMAGIGGSIGIIAIVSGAVTSGVKARQVEQTKRELAAYVAEGSMSADDAFKILAGKETGKNAAGCGPACKCRDRA